MSRPSGYTPTEARKVVELQERQAPPPYLFLGWGRLNEDLTAAKAESLDAPMHATLLEVYREFRRMVPEGRFKIWVGCRLHPQTFRPQDFIALDSQLCEKAFAGQTTPAAKKAA